MSRRRYLVLALVLVSIGIVFALLMGSSREYIATTKVDAIPTVPAEVNQTNANNVTTTSADLSPPQPVSLLPAPLDPLLGRAKISTSALATVKTVYTEESDSVQFVPGVSGQALQFHAYYEDFFSDNHTLALANPTFSVSFWIMRDPNDQNYGHFVSFVNVTTHSGWYFDVGNSTNQEIRFVVTNTNGDLFKTADVKLPLNHYENIVGVFDGANVMIYDNGTLASKVKFNGTYSQNPATPLRVGAGSYCNSCVPTGLSIDELQVYNRALSGSEISSGWSNPGKPFSNSVGLVGYWKFDKDLKDYTGNGNGDVISLIAGMTSTPDGRILFTEKNTGEIEVISQDHVLQTPFAKIKDVIPTIMWGLLGITTDPDFQHNHYVYAYYTAIDNKTGQTFNRVIRLTDANNTGTNMTVIFDHIPALNGYHSGGALAFGSDGKLYFTVGDGYTAIQAQNMSSLLGKTLRINKDGSIPSDNPFPNSPIYTYGHRNVYGIAFDNRTGLGITSENGVDTYDQINLVVKGGNYGWPTLRPADVNPELSNSTMIKPIMVYQLEIAPTAATFYDGDKYPALKGMFLIGSYNRGEIFGIKMDPDGKHVHEMVEVKIPQNTFTDPITSVAATPSGDIYLCGHYVYKLDTLSPLTLLPQ